MFRGQRIARLLIEKEEIDYRLLSTDHSYWYQIDRIFTSPFMLEKFHQLHMDESAQKFLDDSLAVSNSLCLQIFYAFVSSILSAILTKTSINGILGRGGMHIFSIVQLQEFLSAPVDWISDDKKLLDLGAGDGQITAKMAQLYKDVTVTEASHVMEWRLKQRGFKIIAIDKWHLSGSYHLVSALNLLDRHYNPYLLLEQLHSLTLRSNSLLLLAVVLPLKQYVEFHPIKRTNSPDIRILIEGETFEEQAHSLVKDVLEPAGFELVKWTKLPYLCEGDLKRPFYHLDDALFLLKPLSNHSGQNETAQTVNDPLPNRDFISL